MALPKLTEEQRAANLKKAAEARHKRAELCASIKSGETTLEEILASEDETARRLPVKRLLTSLPGIGKAKAEHVMEDLDISEKRRVAGLGARQREALLETLASK